MAPDGHFHRCWGSSEQSAFSCDYPLRNLSPFLCLWCFTFCRQSPQYFRLLQGLGGLGPHSHQCLLMSALPQCFLVSGAQSLLLLSGEDSRLRGTGRCFQTFAGLSGYSVKEEGRGTTRVNTVTTQPHNHWVQSLPEKASSWCLAPLAG